MRNEKKTLNLIIASIICIVVFIIIFLIFILFNGKETHTSDNDIDEPVSVLVCTTGNLENSFYTSDIADAITNEIKIAFKGDVFRKIFYNYKGVYRSTDLAEKDETNLHAKYNIYMGQNNVPQESLSPSYSVTNNKLGITLYADKYDLITRITAPLFFIESDEVETYKTYNLNELEKFYEIKGFFCEYK